MNIVFWALVILAVVAFWFGLCSLFEPIGDFLVETFNAAKEIILNKEEKEKK